jgi:hypothetical protein
LAHNVFRRDFPGEGHAVGFIEEGTPDGFFTAKAGDGQRIFTERGCDSQKARSLNKAGEAIAPHFRASVTFWVPRLRAWRSRRWKAALVAACDTADACMKA